MKTDHILIIRFSALGDVAMTVPIVYALAKEYPALRITMLSQPFARPLFENLAQNVNFMEANIKEEYKGIKGLNALYRRLGAKHFTAVADLHNVIRSSYLRMRFNFDQNHVAHINKHRDLRIRLTAKKNKVLEPIPTAFDNYKEVFADLGYPIHHVDFKSIFPTGQGPLRELPAAIGEKKDFQQWIGIAPFAAHEGKAYPTYKIKNVMDLIVKKHPSARIFLFGAKNERGKLSDIAEHRTNCTIVCDQLSDLRQELILMSHLDVMVSMDSANMHLASLVGTPVVSVWGATHPYAGFMGWNQKEDNAVQVSLPCRPCSIFGNKPCRRGDYACLYNITPAMIAERVEKNL